jgi:hypothetical protein
MPDIASEFLRFETATSESPQAWRSLDVRVIAIGEGEGWKNLLTLVRLDPRPIADLPPAEVLAKTRSVLCMRFALNADELPKLVQQVESGMVRFGSSDVEFASEFASQPKSPYYYSFTSLAGQLDNHFGTDSMAIGHELVISGDSVSTLIASIRGGHEELSQQLRAADPPWDGLEALLDYAMGAPRQFDRYSARFQVRAALAIHFLHKQLRLQDGFLTIATSTSNPAFAHRSSIGFVTMLDGEMIDHGTLQPNPIQNWSRSGDSFIWSETRKVVRGEQVIIFLRVGPFVVDRATVVDERSRVRVPLLKSYEVIDPQLAFLAQWLLSPGKAEQEKFERAVARVFLFCGFAVDSFTGERRLGEAADLVAHSSELMVLLVVECTTGPLQGREGKLSRLSQRAHAIRQAMTAAGDHTSQIEVIPVIASSLDTVSESDRSAANVDKIVVLTNQSLARLLSIARTGAGPKSAMSVLRERGESR